MNKLEVGMYVRGKYYSYKGKIGKIIKNYNGDLEIAYKDSIVKTTVSSFIDDNFDINGKQYVASYKIIGLIQVGDYVNGKRVLRIYKKGDLYNGSFSYRFKEKTIEVENNEYETIPNYALFTNNEIETIVTKEQFSSMEYRLGDK